MTLKDQESKPEIAKLMEQIRSKVRAELAASKDQHKTFRPKHLSFEDLGSVKAGELQQSEDLLYLNRNYVLAGLISPERIVSHRNGILGKLIVYFKRKLSSVIMESILKDLVSHQQDFFAHLVKYLNHSSRYVDARDGDLFWQLIHKIDTDVSNALETIERIRGEISGATHSLEKNTNRAIKDSVDQLNSTLGNSLALQQQHAAAIKTLDSAVRGLEGLVALYSKNSSTSSNDSSAEVSELKHSPPDNTYILLENRFRGSQEDIRERQEMYAKYFADATKPILDVGCGRGELLDLFRSSNIAAKGIDLDKAMIEECKSKQLDVEESDLISFLRKCEDHSLGGLIALQVVEHLPRDILVEFVQLANKKVQPGGRIIFETINPTSLTALSSNYFRDPTHVFPQHPDTLGFLMTISGLDLEETKFLAPIPESAQLRELSAEVYMTPKWTDMVELFNHNIKMINSLLFGFQDYCVVAKVRAK